MSGNNTKSDWIAGLIVFVVGLVAATYFMWDTEADKKKRADEHAKQDEQYAAYREADKKAKQWKEEGAKARDDFDDAMRADSAERRAALEKASRKTTMSNKDGVRIDRYYLKRGGLIICTTTISGNSPAIFNCDGNL